MVPRWLVQVLHPPQKFERPPFWNGWRYEIKKYGVKVTFNGVTSLLNFIKVYQLVEKLLGVDTQTDRQSGYLISLTFPFEESTLKNEIDEFTVRNPQHMKIKKNCNIGVPTITQKENNFIFPHYFKSISRFRCLNTWKKWKMIMSGVSKYSVQTDNGIMVVCHFCQQQERQSASKK
jgi:hypothetical protein